MTKRNLHLAPDKWELKELKVFSNIFGELWRCIGTCAWPHLTPFQLTCKSEFTAEWCANWKSSVLKPAAHSILTPLVSLQVSTQRPKSTKVTCAHCSTIQRYRSTLVPWFQSDTLQGLSRNFFWCRRKHYVLVTSQIIPHQMNLCYFIFHSCSLLPDFTMQKLFLAFAIIDKIKGCNHMSLIFDDDVFNTLSWESCFLLLQSLVV